MTLYISPGRFLTIIGIARHVTIGGNLLGLSITGLTISYIGYIGYININLRA